MKSAIVKRVLILVEVLAVAIAFRLLDKLSYFFFVGLRILPRKPELTIQVIFLLSSVSTAVLIAAVAVLQKLRGRNFSEFHMTKADWPPLKRIGLIILLAGAVQGLIGELIGPVLERAMDAPKALPAVPDLPDLVFSCIAALIGGGLREELFYRGYLMSRVRAVIPWKRSLYVAAGLQIGLFGLSHFYQGSAGILETAILGFACTAVYLSTRSLWCAVLFHGFYDAFGFVLIYFGL